MLPFSSIKKFTDCDSSSEGCTELLRGKSGWTMLITSWILALVLIILVTLQVY
jgi:hypothetical protein